MKSLKEIVDLNKNGKVDFWEVVVFLAIGAISGSAAVYFLQLI